MQEEDDEEEYRAIILEITKEIVALYKSPKEIGVWQMAGREVRLDLDPGGHDTSSLIYVNYAIPGYATFTFYGGLPTESYQIADPTFFVKTVLRLRKMIEYRRVAEETRLTVLEVLKQEQEFQPQP